MARDATAPSASTVRATTVFFMRAPMLSRAPAVMAPAYSDQRRLGRPRLRQVVTSCKHNEYTISDGFNVLSKFEWGILRPLLCVCPRSRSNLKIRKRRATTTTSTEEERDRPLK